MSDALMGPDRAALRELAAAMTPQKTASGARLADQFRLHLPAMSDDEIGAVTAMVSQVAVVYAAATECPHMRGLATLLQAAAAELAGLELDGL